MYIEPKIHYQIIELLKYRGILGILTFLVNIPQIMTGKAIFMMPYKLAALVLAY